MKYRTLEITDMDTIRKWRNESIDTLRTPIMLTKEQQEGWYKNEICNRNSRSRFWAICSDSISDELVGYGGIENIHWETRIAEISLLIGPQFRRNGYATQAAKYILTNAFLNYNMQTVYGEVYYNNNAKQFWISLTEFYNGVYFCLPKRKYSNGKYYDGIYFSIDKDFFE